VYDIVDAHPDRAAGAGKIRQRVKNPEVAELLTRQRGRFLDDGVNENVEGKNVRIIARYSGTAPDYREWCDRVAAGGYRELELA
jgi:hypothetical protein